jgi:hypothetical protein
MRVLLSAQPVWTAEQGSSLLDTLLFTHDSFWAGFGWLTVTPSSRWHGALALLSTLAMVGWIVKPRQSVYAASAESKIMALIFFTALSVLGIEILLVRSYEGYQGRYLFPITIPFVYLIVAGLDRIVFSRHFLTVVIALFFVVFDTWCLSYYIVPYFYG